MTDFQMILALIAFSTVVWAWAASLDARHAQARIMASYALESEMERTLQAMMAALAEALKHEHQGRIAHIQNLIESKQKDKCELAKARREPA